MAAVLSLSNVGFVRDDRVILAPLTWKVAAHERWLVLGANGSGKTTLLRIASMHEHPSSGRVDVLGERLGRTDVRELRRRIGYMSAALAAQIRPELRALDVVMTARYAALEPWWHRYTTADERRAIERSVIDEYLAALEGYGVAVDADDFWRHYCRDAYGGIIMSVVASQIVGANDRSEAMFATNRLLVKNQPRITRKTTMTMYATGELKNDRNSFAGNLPATLVDAKFAQIKDAISDNFGVEPKIYRAGRYGIGPDTARILRTHDPRKRARLLEQLSRPPA